MYIRLNITSNNTREQHTHTQKNAIETMNCWQVKRARLRVEENQHLAGFVPICNTQCVNFDWLIRYANSNVGHFIEMQPRRLAATHQTALAIK